ncbi:MAG: hypothetical protein ACLT1W_11875 [Alistipes onderdonkii]
MLGSLVACAPDRRPVSLIFDTDMGPDYDDVGRWPLHALADSGEVDILATVSSNRLETTVPCIDVLNTISAVPTFRWARKGERLSGYVARASAGPPAAGPTGPRSASRRKMPYGLPSVLAASPDTMSR